MQSEILARITDQNEKHVALQVCRKPCAGCNGRCGAWFLANSVDQPVSVAKPYFQSSLEQFDVGNQVKVGISLKTLMGLSLLVYLAPLVLMLLSAIVCFQIFSQTNGAVAISACVGLFGGLMVVRFLLALLEKNKASETLFIQRHPDGA